MKPQRRTLCLVITAALCAGLCVEAAWAQPGADRQAYVDGIRAVCAGEKPDAIDAIAVDEYLLDTTQPKAMRLLVLRDAVERAGLSACARLHTMAAFEPVPQPPRAVFRRSVKRKKVVRAVVEGSTVEGACDAGDVSRIIEERRRGLQYCYEKELARSPTLAGEVTMGWAIGGDGTVQRAEVVATTLDNKTVEGCMARQVRRWQFQTPTRGTCAVKMSIAFNIRGRAPDSP